MLLMNDMSIQANVLALAMEETVAVYDAAMLAPEEVFTAMEEIAPVAVNDAAMLAPKEVFTDEGNIEEDAELTQLERKKGGFGRDLHSSKPHSKLRLWADMAASHWFEPGTRALGVSGTPMFFSRKKIRANKGMKFKVGSNGA